MNNVITTPPSTSNSGSGNETFLTQLLNAQTTPVINNTSRLQFNTATRLVDDPSLPSSKTRNPDLPVSRPLGHLYLVDTSDMEESTLSPYSDELDDEDDASGYPSLPVLVERDAETSNSESEDTVCDDDSVG